ncbi:MAG: hypothetical protein AB9903_33885 [Vulcanimicrobiota bacterium]
MVKKLLIIIIVVAVVALILSILPNDGFYIDCSPENNQAEFAIVDPLGRYLGYEPSKNNRVIEDHHQSGSIPGSCYFYTPIQSLGPENVVIDSPKYLTIYKPIAGLYVIKVFGISNSEHYTINMDPPTIEGVVKHGQIIDYYLMFIPTPFGIIQSVVRAETANTITPIIIVFIVGIALFSVRKRNLFRSTGNIPVF